MNSFAHLYMRVFGLDFHTSFAKIVGIFPFVLKYFVIYWFLMQDRSLIYHMWKLSKDFYVENILYVGCFACCGLIFFHFSSFMWILENYSGTSSDVLHWRVAFKDQHLTSYRLFYWPLYSVFVHVFAGLMLASGSLWQVAGQNCGLFLAWFFSVRADKARGVSHATPWGRRRIGQARWCVLCV